MSFLFLFYFYLMFGSIKNKEKKKWRDRKCVEKMIFSHLAQKKNEEAKIRHQL